MQGRRADRLLGHAERPSDAAALPDWARPPKGQPNLVGSARSL